MLTLGKLAPGQQHYYLQTVARGAEEYYTGAKEAPGQWCGTSAARLGLEGEVSAETLHRLLSHQDPATSERLTDGRSDPKVVGFDATFCAPKSVSLLFALGQPEASNEVRNAHDVAVADSLAVYEQVARGRRDKAGTRLVGGEGFAAAAFRHRTSRAADPQLHTHVVVANLVHAPEDGRWSALDARPLYQWARAIGHLYEAELRYELTRRLGVAWGPVRNGMADIDGIGAPVLKAFSTRRAEIEVHLAERGEAGPKAAQAAAYATRRAKDPTLEAGDLNATWRDKAAGLGLDDRALARVLNRRPHVEPPAPDRPEAQVLYHRLASPDGLTASRSTFTRRQVIEAVCDALPEGGRVGDVLALVDGFVASEHVIALGAGQDAPVMRQASGRVLPAGDVEERWTTPEMLAVEQALVLGAAARRHDSVGLATPMAVDAALAQRPMLSTEQQAMVEYLCRSGSGVDVIEGVAGSGKTFALAAAREAWVGSGHRVLGASLAARAAARLEEGSGIPSTSLDRLLRRLERGDGLSGRDVVVVDEAAMVGSRKLARLLDHAQAAHVKVVLVGDPCQLPELAAGGAFAGLARRLAGPGLVENRRQEAAWERGALAHLRAGEADRAVDTYLLRGRVHTADSDDAARGQLVTDWWHARQAGEHAVMVAPRLRQVDDLNRRARTYLKESRVLWSDDTVLGGRSFAMGDEVLVLRNDYDIGILNGARGRIELLDRLGRRLFLRNEDGRLVEVPFAYAEAGHLTHGYATTIHKAQGSTVERAFVLADDTMSREHIYTALSRGVRRTDLYLASDDARVDLRHAPELASAMPDRLRYNARRSAAQQMAMDQGPDDRHVPVEALRAERDRLRRLLAVGPPDPRSDLRRVSDRLRAARESRDHARWRRDAARQRLDDLGPIGRRLRRQERSDAKQLVKQAERDLVRFDQKIDRLGTEANQLVAARTNWRDWAAEHSDELRRLRVVERALDSVVRDQGRSLDRARDRRHGVELGLGP